MDNEHLIEQMRAYIGLAYSIFCDNHAVNHDDAVKAISSQTGMCRSTVRSLVDGDTTYPRYLTLKKFGDACGLHLIWTKAGQPRLKLAS